MYIIKQYMYMFYVTLQFPKSSENFLIFSPQDCEALLGNFHSSYYNNCSLPGG